MIHQNHFQPSKFHLIAISSAFNDQSQNRFRSNQLILMNRKLEMYAVIDCSSDDNTDG